MALQEKREGEGGGERRKERGRGGS